ncbi:hypothetical protein CEXT_400411 [Caerostris extrusa]|uniref:Uncharacterized protein n=1 Tax=Caerostris extrusa TaxID=172846 RepID=A0AAV4Q9I0_CAEEX|nr:hypothetical protein CEXT_400411 [Caerostris extrusa]
MEVWKKFAEDDIVFLEELIDNIEVSFDCSTAALEVEARLVGAPPSPSVEADQQRIMCNGISPVSQDSAEISLEPQNNVIDECSFLKVSCCPSERCESLEEAFEISEINGRAIDNWLLCDISDYVHRHIRCRTSNTPRCGFHSKAVLGFRDSTAVLEALRLSHIPFARLFRRVEVARVIRSVPRQFATGRHGPWSLSQAARTTGNGRLLPDMRMCNLTHMLAAVEWRTQQKEKSPSYIEYGLLI